MEHGDVHDAVSDHRRVLEAGMGGHRVKNDQCSLCVSEQVAVPAISVEKARSSVGLNALDIAR